jgi:uncharacterized protein YndB with AHSA1/START domain
MTDATILASDGRPTVRLERQLVDPPSIVWRALTERDQLQSWFPCDVIVAGGEWKVGATISFPFPPEIIDTTLTGEVIECEEPSRLAFSWGTDILRFELTELASGTRLVLFNELDPSGASRNAAGWDDCLDKLVGLGVKPDAWQIHFDHYRHDFKPVLGPQDGPPAGYKEK